MSKAELDALDVLSRALGRLNDQGVILAGEVHERMLDLIGALEAVGLLDDEDGEVKAKASAGQREA